MTDAARLREFDTDEHPVAWREEMDGLTAEIGYEEDTTHYNPRGDDNLGTMLAWHPDYILGDQQFKDAGGRGAVKTLYTDHDFDSIGELAEKLLADGAVCVIPLYLYDHSGISISTGVAVGETLMGGRDEFGTPRGWDTTLVGVIYTTPERIRELCGEPQLESDPFYCPRTWPEDGRSGQNWPRERAAAEWIEEQLKNEVEIYDRYLRGEVYWWCVEDADGEVLASRGGYLPDVGVPYAEELDYVRSEAHEALVEATNDRRAAAALEREEADRAASMDIATT